MKLDRVQAFSLVEIVVALAVCSFTLVALVGLFGIGLKARRESQDYFQASNLASQIITSRLASPQQDGPMANPPLPAAKLKQTYNTVYGTSNPAYVDEHGQLVSNAADAAYGMVCYSGTNPVTGPALAQVYLVLYWPPQAPVNQAAGKYEIVTFIPVQ